MGLEQKTVQIVLKDGGVLGLMALPALSDQPSLLGAIPFQEVFENISSQKRKIEIASAHWILKNLAGRWIKILRDAHGRPHLEGSTNHISISHDSTQIAVLFSPLSSVAVDIESLQRDISNLKPKFCSDAELSFAENLDHPNPELLIWGAKECLFKASSEVGIDFKAHLSVDLQNYSSSSSYFNGTLKKGETLENFTINVLIRDNHQICFIHE